jgi:site-specific DNA recombinase
MIAAVYARKSTAQADVAEEAKSVTRQVDGARAFITAKGGTLDELHVYTDDGVSGALFANRTEFQRMLRDAEAGAFAHLVLYDLDRFGRNARQTMLALNTLADLGVAVWDYSTGAAVDLDSFEGEMMTFMKARFAQQYRDQVRKHTRDAMRQKAEQGYVTGGKVFGYDNVRLGKGQTTRVPNEAEAAVVRTIYERFAEGDGLRTIALALNNSGALSPRAQQGRPNGWSSSSVREVLQRPVYRGEVVFGKTASAYGRELGQRKTRDGKPREQGQIPRPEESWIRREVPLLRIVDADLATRVDARRESWRGRYVASKARGRAPQNASGKYLLSGGMLVCPTCGGHFEAFKSPWTAIYVCATRRRKPGVCTNTLALPIADTDDAVLEMVEGEVLGTRFIEELLALVDRGEADNTALLTADRERLAREVSNLMDLVANGVPADTVAPKIRERETQIARLDVQLRTPRQQPPNIEKLREALMQRAAQWKADLRDEPKVARLLLRRLVGPLTLWDAAVPSAEWLEWDAALTPALLEGLVPIQVVASPTGFANMWNVPVRFCTP